MNANIEQKTLFTAELQNQDPATIITQLLQMIEEDMESYRLKFGDAVNHSPYYKRLLYKYSLLLNLAQKSKFEANYALSRKMADDMILFSKIDPEIEGFIIVANFSQNPNTNKYARLSYGPDQMPKAGLSPIGLSFVP